MSAQNPSWKGRGEQLPPSNSSIKALCNPSRSLQSFIQDSTAGQKALLGVEMN
jgi:hypothetical protein